VCVISGRHNAIEFTVGEGVHSHH